MSVLLYEKYLVQGEFHVTLPELLTLMSFHSLNFARLNPVAYSSIKSHRYRFHWTTQ